MYKISSCNYWYKCQPWVTSNNNPFCEIHSDLQSIHFSSQFLMSNEGTKCANIYQMQECFPIPNFYYFLFLWGMLSIFRDICHAPYTFLNVFGILISFFLHNTFTSTTPLWEVLRIITSFPPFQFSTIIDLASVYWTCSPQHTLFCLFLSLNWKTMETYSVSSYCSTNVSLPAFRYKSPFWAAAGSYLHVLCRFY